MKISTARVLIVISLHALLCPNLFANEASTLKIKALAFDAFPILDPRPIKKTFEELYPGQGGQLMEAWRTRLFEYQWLRVLGGEYKDFLDCADDALTFAAKQLNLPLTEKEQTRLRQVLLNLNSWPDAGQAIKQLHEMGLQLVFLSNMTEPMLANGLKNADLDQRFSHILSTDSIRSFKPSTSAYALAVDRLNLKKEEILFVAFAGWDAAGAKWYGYPTYWVNRLGLPSEALDSLPDGEGKSLSDLVDFVQQQLNLTE